MVEDVRPEPWLAGLRLALEGERPVADGRGARDEPEVSSSSSRYGSPASRMRAGSEWAVKTTCGSSSPATVRTRRASAATNAGSAPQRRTNRVSTRPATASSKSASYFATDIVEKCGARTSPTSRSASRASASSTAVAMRGSQWRMPVSTGKPSSHPSAARVASVTALSGEGSSESSIPSAR